MHCKRFFIGKIDAQLPLINMELGKASNMHTISKRFQQDIIIIDDNDSDYETSSSHSTSPQLQCDPSKNQ